MQASLIGPGLRVTSGSVYEFTLMKQQRRGTMTEETALLEISAESPFSCSRDFVTSFDAVMHSVMN
jgi:hypothetical protein